MTKPKTRKAKKAKHPEPQLVNVSDLNPASYNPRSISEREMKSLQASIRLHGMVTSVVVQKKGMTIIGGHQRVLALEQMRANGETVPEEVWAIVLEVGDEEAKRMNVALNRISGEFDEDLLAGVFKEIDLSEETALAMGFDVAEIEALIADSDIDPTEEAERLEAEAAGIPTFGKSITLTLEFDTVENRDLAKGRLKEISPILGKRPGNVVLDALDKLKVKKPRAKAS